MLQKEGGQEGERLFIWPFVQLVIIVFAKRTSGISHYNVIHKCPNSNVHTLDFLEKALPHIFLVQTMKKSIKSQVFVTISYSRA